MTTETILFLAHTEDDGSLSRAALETLTGARELHGRTADARFVAGFIGGSELLDALADVLVKVSYLAVQLNGQLAELDINPLLVLPKGQGVKAVDALVAFKGK